jgi:deoxyribonuclease V
MDRGEHVGAVLRTQNGVKPLYISVGNAVTLPQAVKWVLRLAVRVRLPEPIRAADRMASQLKARL